MGPSPTRAVSRPPPGGSSGAVPGPGRRGNPHRPPLTRAGLGSSEAEDLGAGRSAVLAVAIATGGVVVMSSGKQADLCRTGAAGEHREGGKAGALGHGLPGWDPDLSGGTGRLAVLRDQPGQRDLHRVARARPGDLSGPGALPGERQPGGAAVWLDTCLSEPVGRGDRRRRGRAQRGSGRARLRHLGSAEPNVRLLRVGHHHGRGEASGRPGGDPERHAGPWPGGVRTHRRAGHEPVSPARGQHLRPARR